MLVSGAFELDIVCRCWRLGRLCMAASPGQQADLRMQHSAQATISQEMTMLWMPSSTNLTNELDICTGCGLPSNLQI